MVLPSFTVVNMISEARPASITAGVYAFTTEESPSTAVSRSVTPPFASFCACSKNVNTLSCGTPAESD